MVLQYLLIQRYRWSLQHSVTTDISTDNLTDPLLYIVFQERKQFAATLILPTIDGYFMLFHISAKKVNAYKIAHPKQRVISLGIGDVTQPLCPAVIQAMHKAVEEMAVQASFRGYGPERGYDFLREAIIKNDFLPRGIHLDVNEVFVNDGAKSDTGNIQEILRWDNNIGVTDPIYPVYIDSNVMIGRAGVFENGRWSNVV